MAKTTIVCEHGTVCHACTGQARAKEIADKWWVPALFWGGLFFAALCTDLSFVVPSWSRLIGVIVSVGIGWSIGMSIVWICRRWWR